MGFKPRDGQLKLPQIRVYSCSFVVHLFSSMLPEPLDRGNRYSIKPLKKAFSPEEMKFSEFPDRRLRRGQTWDSGFRPSAHSIDVTLRAVLRFCFGARNGEQETVPDTNGTAGDFSGC